VTVKDTITLIELIGKRYCELRTVGVPQFRTHCLAETINAEELITSKFVAPGVVRVMLNV